MAACRSFNISIPWLNGTWKENYAGPRFPPRGNYSLAFIKVGPAYFLGVCPRSRATLLLQEPLWGALLSRCPTFAAPPAVPAAQH